MNVPCFKQPTRRSCGTTALRMILAYWGKDISVRELNRAVGGLKSFGCRTTSLAHTAKDLGFDVDVFHYCAKPELCDPIAVVRKPSIKLLTDYLEKDIPVLLCVRSYLLYDKKPSRNGHFIVLTDYHDETFFYNDPYTGQQESRARDELFFAWSNNVLDSSAHMLVVRAELS